MTASDSVESDTQFIYISVASLKIVALCQFTPAENLVHMFYQIEWIHVVWLSEPDFADNVIIIQH